MSQQWCPWLVSLVLQVSLDQRALLAHLAPQVRTQLACLDPLDPLDPLDLLASLYLGNLVLLVGQANLVSLEPMERKVIQELLVFRDPGECLDPLEAPDPLASPPQASLGLMVFQEQMDKEGRQV